MLPYREVLDRWERSKAFGDPRGLEDFSKDQNALTQSDEFSAPLSAGWWTKASTAADKYLFEPVASVTTAPVGEAIGGLFGGGGAEVGRKVGQSLPRALAQTLPLYLAGPEAGVPATVAALGLTGAAFAGQTYADTQSGKKALVSGLTAAALPVVGRYGGNLAAKAFGVGEDIAEPFAATVAKEGSEAGFRTARVLGSQAAQIGTLQTSQYLQDREHYDPLSPEFWANQIPFTVFDLVSAGTHEVPTKAKLAERYPTQVTKPVKPYEPPTSTTEERATVEAALAELERVASNPTATTEEKEAAFAAAVGTTAGPRDAIEVKRATRDAEGPMVQITGFGKLYENGNMKVLVDPDRSPGVATPEHGNVWVNKNPLLDAKTNPDGSFTITTPAKYVNQGVESPLVRGDFGLPNVNQPDLPVQAKPWTGPLAPDDARTLQKNGLEPKPDLSPMAHELEQAAQQERTARESVAKIPQSAEDVAQLVPPAVAKPVIEKAVKNGATPTQAVEKARLTTHTPVVDESLQKQELLRTQAREHTTVRPTPSATLLDENGDRRYFPSAGEAEQFLTLYRQEHPEDQDTYRVTPRKDTKEESYFIRKEQKSVSIEGSEGHSLENVLTSAIEDRPDVSFDDMLSQLDRASNAPRQFGNAAGIADVPDAILAIRRAKVIFPTLREGKNDFESINKALKEKGILPFENEQEYRTEMRKVREGLQDFSRSYRSFTLGSTKPYDPELVKAIGIQEGGLGAALDWWIAHPKSGIMGEFAKVLKAAVPDLDKVEITSRPEEGMQYFVGPRRVNIPDLPANDTEAQQWALMVTHEVAHDASAQMYKRTDPAAVKFRSTLTQAMDAIRNSPHVPTKVKAALTKMPEWQAEWHKGGEGSSANFMQKWADVAGVENMDWFQFGYGMSSEAELLAQMFGSRKMVEVMSRTKMPRTVGQSVLQWFSQVWNRLFGGGVGTDSVLAHVMSGFDNYLSGTKATPNVLTVRPTLSAGQNFLYGLAPYDPDRNLMGGKHPLPKNGQVPEAQFKSIGGVGKPLSDGEIELYRSIVPEAFVQGKVDVPKLVKGLEERGPVVEVKKLGETARTPEQQELARLVHFIETNSQYVTLGESNEPGSLKVKEGAPQELVDAVNRARELKNSGVTDFGTAATYQFIAPKPESEMPGYVEGLVRVPLKKFRKDVLWSQQQKGELYRGPHFGSEDTNVLSFYRGYEETLPNGEKAFHVIEVQSDWGQNSRDYKKRVAEGDQDDVGFTSDHPVADHPLLRVYESLALKAAIAHAKEVGATKVILSDAETAMMTEGHDRNAAHGAGRLSGALTAPDTAGNRAAAERFGVEYEIEGNVLHVMDLPKNASELIQNSGFNYAQARIPQEKGMRLHYDQTLPSAMEKLTGVKGERVDLGRHKAQGRDEYFRGQEHASLRTKSQAAIDLQELQQENPGATFRSVLMLDGTYSVFQMEQGSPVFRDASGAPKTQITGRSYDLGKVEQESTLFENKVPKVDVRQSYNGRDYLRDTLIHQGVRPEALASRLATVEKLYNTGDIQTSLDGLVSEAQAGTLEATSTITPDFVPSNVLATGTPAEVGKFVGGLLADDVPKYEDVFGRLQADMYAVTNLYQNIKKGLVPGELPPNTFENLQKAQFKIDAMFGALKKQNNAIERWRNLDNFTYEGFEDTQAHQLVERRLPAPPDPTGMEDEAHGLLGLEEIRRATAEAELQGKESGVPGPISRALMLTQYVKKLYPSFRPVADHVRLQIGKAIQRITTLNLSYSYDPETKGFSKTLAKENARVANTESLQQAASDIYRIAQLREAAGKEWSFTDPEVTSILTKFNQKDRQAIINEHNSNRARHHVYTEQALPESLTELNNEYTAKVIAARETGMLPQEAREASQQLYGALGLMAKPETAPAAAEALRAVSAKMQPDTFLAALQHAKTMVDATNAHLEFMRSRPSYVSEQRYGKYHLVMRGPNGESFRVSKDNPEDLRKIQVRQEKEGYTLLDFLPKSDANMPAGGVNADVLNKMQELDIQAWNAMEAALKDVDPVIVARVLPATQRAAQYEASAQAFKPTPGVTRKFVGGREYINMIDNAHEFYVRANNWLRHKLTDATTSLDMMHPDIAANRSLKAYADQHVQNSLTPDSPFFRKFVEATYFQRLGYSLGNSVLESVQNLATGMQALISENGGIGDSFKLWGGAVKNIIKYHTTKKWDNAEHEWVMRQAKEYGASGLTTWNDIVDPDRESTYATLNMAKGGLGSVPQALLYGARKWATVFQRYNDQIGWLAGYDLGRSKGMSQDEAFNFAWDVKERGYFSGGKAQRPVGLWSIKTKPVPQMLSSLQTYTLGWFSQMATDWKIGFGGHSGFTSSDRLAAKKAFLYGLGAQAVLAGAIGLPGMGQGMALLKQSTGIDLKGKLRSQLAGLFGEDDEYGGMLTNLALRGGLAGITPIDPSNRAAISFPFVGIDPYKGFDLSALLGAPGSTVSDMVQGLLAAANGDAVGVQRLLPSALKPTASLIQGEGDVRDKRGALLYKLSPSERFLTAIGLPSSRIQSARDTAEAVKNLNDAAQRQRQGLVDELAVLARTGRVQEVQRRLSEFHAANPKEDLATLVRSVGERVTAQTVPYDYRRDLNPGADIAGLGQRMPSTELLRRQTAQDVEARIGLRIRPNPRADAHAAMLDDLMNSDPYLARSEAVRTLGTLTARRRSNVSLPEEYQ